ncbi:hypothetical protein K7432_016401 [Basidiobolus ranarum]|uniref:DUF8032 domain-containing protein n=1 Tax=Basidiobolus ranarum TaxID=34480 RepID=A0ABR2VLW4_9FUNG
MKDDVEWLCFSYTHKKCMQRHEIRIDVDTVNSENIEHQFRIDNCVYPRAFCSKEEYHGNRWHYETECNDLGWRLSYLNQELLSGKRGLIQRAVDSFRNRHPNLRSRRVARQEKLNNGTLRKRKPHSSMSSSDSTTSSDSPLNTPDSDTMMYQDVHSGALWPVCVNIGEVNAAEINDDFKRRNSIFMRGLMKTDHPYVAQQMSCNEIAWKLAWLNPQYLDNRKLSLQRVVDIYRNKFSPDLQPRPSRNTGSSQNPNNSPMGEFSLNSARSVSLSLKMIADNANQFLTPASAGIDDDSLTTSLLSDNSTEFLADQFWQQLLKPSM